MTAPDRQAEADAQRFEAACDLLANPLELAARAVDRAAEADEIHTMIRESVDPDGPDSTLLVRQRSALAVATVLADLAELGRRLAVDEREVNPARMLDLGDAEDAQDAPERPAPLTDGWPTADRPEPVQARFTARLEGKSFLIADVEMLFIRGCGWIPVDGFDRDYSAGRLQFVLTGRARSRYRDRMLVTTDSGVAMVLPTDVVTLEPDE